jgi:tellurite resistance protein
LGKTILLEKNSMGLFDKMFSTTRSAVQETFSPAEAFAAISIASISADGYLADEEVDLLVTTLNRMHLFRSYSSDVMRRMMDKLFGIQKREGVEMLFSIAQQSLPHELKASAFAVATDLVLADGEVTEEERKFLNQLYQALEIPEEQAITIVNVMMIKNQG